MSCDLILKYGNLILETSRKLSFIYKLTDTDLKLRILIAPFLLVPLLNNQC